MDFQFFRRKLSILKYEPEKLIKNKMTMSKLSVKQEQPRGSLRLSAINSTPNKRIHTKAVVQMYFEFNQPISFINMLI